MHTVLLCMHIAIMYMRIIILATLSLCSMFIGVYFEEELEALILAMEFLPTTLARCISTHIYTYHRSGEIILYVNKVIGPLAGQATSFVKNYLHHFVGTGQAGRKNNTHRTTAPYCHRCQRSIHPSVLVRKHNMPA